MASPFDTFVDSAAPSSLQRPEEARFSSLGRPGDDWGLGTRGGKDFFSMFYNLLLMALKRDLASECRCDCPAGGDPESNPFASYQRPEDESGLPLDLGIRGRAESPSEFGTYPRGRSNPRQEVSEYGEVPDYTQEPSEYGALTDPGTQQATDASSNRYTWPGDDGLPSDVSALDRSGPTVMPEPTSVVQVNKPIVVEAGQVFDGGNRLFQAGSGLGNGGQSEGQLPIFILKDGATLRNVQLAGADGVHVYGDARLEQVWWRDVGEDALTMKTTGNVVILGGGAYKADDKIFQLNAGGSFRVFGFHADGFGKAIRTNGGKEFDIDIQVHDSVFANGEEAIVRTDARGARVALNNVQSQGLKSEVLAPVAANVSGTASVDYKPFSG